MLLVDADRPVIKARAGPLYCKMKVKENGAPLMIICMNMAPFTAILAYFATGV